MNNRDSIYSKSLKKVPKFVFDKRVASVFDDMISRSVPGYHDIVQMTGILAAHYVRPKTNVYDLGCSLGTVSNAILKSIPSRAFELIAVDASEAMIERARKNLQKKVNLKCARLEEVQIHKASMVILNFVLQFIARENRSAILKKIYRGMIPGGVLVFSEKISFSTRKEQVFQQKLYEEFKSMRGYSRLEISQKRTALEKVLIPETLKIHEARLKKAGFREVYVWFRCFNFVSLIAMK